MSAMRRRSQNLNEAKLGQDDKPTVDNQPRGLSKRAISAYIVCSLLVAGLLIAWFQWESIANFGHFSISSSWSPSRPTSPESSKFALHPRDHTNRPATTLRYNWRITKQSLRPDGVLKNIYCINDEFPGPTIEARSGDRLIVEVENGLQDEAMSVHWHGLSMRDANHMDGAVGITQDGIKPGSTFTYDFLIDDAQHGTFWYHAHSQVQRADGLYGGLIVHDPQTNQTADAEQLLMLSDWYHRSAEEALDFYMHPGSFGNEPVPDSILLNGKGLYSCADAVQARPVDCQQRRLVDLPTLRLDASKHTVLRMINVGSYAGVEFSLGAAEITPVRVDGGNPVSGRSAIAVGYLHPGERVDVVVGPTYTRNSGQEMLTVSLDTSAFKYPNSALTATHFYPLAWENRKPHRFPMKARGFSLSDLEDLKSGKDLSPLIPTAADQTMVLYTITQKLSHLRNVPHGFINQTTWTPQATPPSPLTSLDRSIWDKHQFVPHIEYRSDNPLWVDVVLNNLDEEGHPFHLHGYDFWVLSKYSSTYNWGSYNPFEDDEPPGGQYDLVGAVKKDTVLVPRRGYAVLRLRADNPGIWMFHCHNLWHQASGMAMAFDVS